MLSIFPSLLSYQQLSPFLVRLALGAVFIFWAYRGLRAMNVSSHGKIVALIEAASGILLVIGLWTQIASLVAGIDLIIRLVERAQKKAFLTDGVNYYLLLLVLAISLMVTGAGRLAFDLPL